MDDEHGLFLVNNVSDKSAIFIELGNTVIAVAIRNVNVASALRHSYAGRFAKVLRIATTLEFGTEGQQWLLEISGIILEDLMQADIGEPNKAVGVDSDTMGHIELVGSSWDSAFKRVGIDDLNDVLIDNAVLLAVEFIANKRTYKTKSAISV